MIHIIAEAGTNHNGSVEQAKELIELASRTGADSVKFQLINTWGLYLPGQYEYGKYDIAEVLALRKQTELSDEAYGELARFGSQKGIAVSSSVFDPDGLKTIQDLNPPYIKIASCDLNHISFIREVFQTADRMVLSTGMSTLEDIDRSVNELAKVGSLDKLVLLHCVSVYPASLEQTNLSFITTLKNKFGTQVGFSDHTPDSRAALVALGLGATWFEKHFTTDRTLKGLDHAYAMEEEGMTAYVKDLKTAASAMQPKPDKISEAERNTRKRARRSLYAARDLSVGTQLSADDILVVRPEGPLQAEEFDRVVGKTVTKAMEKHQPFRWEGLD